MPQADRLVYVLALEQWLTTSGVTFDVLRSETVTSFADSWLEIYEYAFAPGHRFRKDAKAEHAYLQESSPSYVVFSAPCALPGTHVSEMGYPLPDAYRCQGPVISFWDFREQEPVVVPDDLAWTMVYVDPDPFDDGPYFVRREWLAPEGGARGTRTRRLRFRRP